MKRFERRGVIVIGGAGGIGRAIARRAAAEGARVGIADLEGDGAAATAAELGGAAATLDVTDENSVKEGLSRLVEAIGGVRAVACTAGLLVAHSVENTPQSAWDRTMAVNAGGSFLVTKHAIPYLREAGGGSLVLFSSTSGLSGAPGEAAYAASKAAVIGLMRVAAAELASDGIRVNCICPGWIDTAFNDPVWTYLGGRSVAEMSEIAAIPLRRQGTPEEVAALAAFLLSDDASYVTGTISIVDGGANGAG